MSLPKGVAEGIERGLKALEEPAFKDLSPVKTIEEAKQQMARGQAEVILPLEEVHLTRLWNQIHKILGPGKTLLDELVAAFPPLGNIVRSAAKVYLEANTPPLSLYRSARMRSEMGKILKWFDDVHALIKVELHEAAPLMRQAYAKPGMQDPLKSYLRALEEFRGLMERQRGTMGSLAKDAATSALARLERRGMTITRFLTGKASRGTAAVGYAFRSLRLWADAVGRDPLLLVAELVKRMAASKKETLVAAVWHLIPRDSLVFARALGIIAHLKLKGGESWATVVNAVKTGAPESVKGHLNQFRGLLPEEASAKLGALEGLGRKKAFEVMADLPLEMSGLAGKMSLEHIKGPFYIKSGGNLVAEFGDGATLLLEPGGKSAYLLLLGESKSYLPFTLFEQLFKRSDPRFAGQRVHFVDETGELRSLILKPPPGNHSPSYVFSTPLVLEEAQAAKREAIFSRMNEIWGNGEREVHKLDLPFTREHNESFAWMLFQECVKLVESL